jgi:protein associated with RNAse G/E
MGDEVVLIRKLAYDGRETWRWSGKLVDRSDGVMVVDAVFNGAPRDLGYMKLEVTDLYHEFYYTDRWYNIFQVFRADGLLKGWYCNICKPAHFAGNEVSFVDMVLDVFVYPDGRPLVLDEDEFQQLAETTYSAEDAQAARSAVDDLLHMARTRAHPFQGVGGQESGVREPDQDERDEQG